MPSIRKRIGYLPSIKAHETITQIAIKEKLSQSKVVGILVEEALLARGEFDLQKCNDLVRKNLYSKDIDRGIPSCNHNDLDELISDKGIIYKTKKYNYTSKLNSSKPEEQFNDELLEQFKQFILFRKMEQNK